jgi:hypothetical protein
VVEPTVLATVEVQATPDASIMPVTVRQFVIDATQSSAQYAVNEVFLREDRPYRAVGTTNVVSGTFVVATEGVPAGKVSKIQIDLRTLQSDSGRRDNAIRERQAERTRRNNNAEAATKQRQEAALAAAEKQRERQRQVRENFSRRYQAIALRFSKELAAWYPGATAATVKHAEAFELCEYGSQPDRAALKRLFPFFD